jgi:hypothetical protein
MGYAFEDRSRIDEYSRQFGFSSIEQMMVHPVFKNYCKEDLENVYRSVSQYRIERMIRTYGYFICQNIGRIPLEELDKITSTISFLLRTENIILNKTKEDGNTNKSKEEPAY